ncbi:MAG TPA: hypothetical protein VI318_19535 [Baekduia sp.]
MPFTLCLDVTLRVAACPRTAGTAARLQAELDALARDPRHWAFRAITASAEDGDLVVHARLLEPVEDLYEADPERPGGLGSTDIVLHLLARHCATWRALGTGERTLHAETRRVRRRFWTHGEADQRASRT